jgi:hypothetical protein
MLTLRAKRSDFEDFCASILCVTGDRLPPLPGKTGVLSIEGIEAPFRKEPSQLAELLREYLTRGGFHQAKPGLLTIRGTLLLGISMYAAPGTFDVGSSVAHRVFNLAMMAPDTRQMPLRPSF